MSATLRTLTRFQKFALGATVSMFVVSNARHSVFKPPPTQFSTAGPGKTSSTVIQLNEPAGAVGMAFERSNHLSESDNSISSHSSRGNQTNTSSLSRSYSTQVITTIKNDASTDEDDNAHDCDCGPLWNCINSSQGSEPNECSELETQLRICMKNQNQKSRNLS